MLQLLNIYIGKNGRANLTFKYFIIINEST